MKKEEKINKSVIIAGGGTGGHVFPAIAIAHALQRRCPGIKILFVGARGKIEMEQVPKAGFEVIGLDIVGFNRKNVLKNWLLPLKLFQSRRASLRILKEFLPHAVVGVGGYASFPILSAAQKMRVPTILQEQNSFAGKSNKILGKKADVICVAYNNMDRFFPKEKIALTGNPVRHEITHADITHEEGVNAFRLSPLRKTVLVVGGSLGARSINNSIRQGLSEIKGMNLQLIWQTGKTFYSEAKDVVGEDCGDIIVKDFIHNMEYAYAAADIIISRAGALACAELCMVGKPVIFVPYPYAAEDHQTSNAMALVQHNAAMIVKDNEVDQELMKKLRAIVADEHTQQIMAENIKQQSLANADDKIAEKIIEIMKKAEA